MEKKIKIVTIVVAILALSIFFALFFLTKNNKGNFNNNLPNQQKEENKKSGTDSKIQAQLNKLDELRKEQGDQQPMTQEKIDAQSKNLDAINEKINASKDAQPAIKETPGQVDELEALNE